MVRVLSNELTRIYDELKYTLICETIMCNLVHLKYIHFKCNIK